MQAVYTVLREAEHRSTAPIPYWNFPFAAMLVPQQRKVQEALVTINSTLDSLICKCKQLVIPSLLSERCQILMCAAAILFRSAVQGCLLILLWGGVHLLHLFPPSAITSLCLFLFSPPSIVNCVLHVQQ